MSAPPRAAVLSLYRSLLRTGKTFAEYNFRSYVGRSTRERFRANRALADGAAAAGEFERGLGELEVARRQAMIHNAYAGGQRSVMEAPLASSK